MLNLFLAILLGNFDKARTYWLKKRIFEMFDIAVKRDYTLQKALGIILGEVSQTVSEELLVHEPKDIFKLNGRLSIINRKLMLNDPEGEDQIQYYDKVALYQLDYKPIEEIPRDESEEINKLNLDSDIDSAAPFDFKKFNNDCKTHSRIIEEEKEEFDINRLNKQYRSLIPRSESKMLLNSKNHLKAESRLKEQDYKGLQKSYTKMDDNKQFSVISENESKNNKHPLSKKSNDEKLLANKGDSFDNSNDEENPKIFFTKVDSAVGMMDD